MMKIDFYKYQGTGNDFIMIDQMNQQYDLSQEQISLLCDRRFGIGGDGLIMLRKSKGVDFVMKYYNSDGRESSMCGNGGRCIVKFAFDLNYIQRKTIFEAIDGMHEAEVLGENVSLGMSDVSHIRELKNDAFELNTGSPHYVKFEADKNALNTIVEYGKSIRYNQFYKANGINVNIVVEENGLLNVATYERGVEDETYICGTGVTAAALCYAKLHSLEKGDISISTKGGILSVAFIKEDENFKKIRLVGPAICVFIGNCNV